MQRRQLGLAFATAASIVCAGAPRASAQSDDVTLLRVFLADGRSLVSYGEPARVGDRVVFSMPASTAPGGPLELVNIPADRIDWTRTNRYTETVRSKRYMETQAENDYAMLSNEIAQALN